MCQRDDMTRERFMNDLSKKRTIYLEGEIVYTDAKEIGKSILWLNAQDDSSEITLYINSSGGSVKSGLDLYDIVRHSNAPITGIVYRLANSMASIILQACKTRKALRHSEISLHNIRFTEEWHKLEENLEKALKDVKRDQQALYEILAKRTGKPIEEIIKVCRESREMTAEEAKEFGLIDEII